MSRIRVIYIAGPSRSGSTLISRILGSLDGFFNCGELMEIWDRGFLAQACSCGFPLERCAFWRAVFARIGAIPEGPELADLVRMRDSAVRSRKVPRWLLLRRMQKLTDPRLDAFSTLLDGLYRSIAEVSAADVLIDASKNVGYGFLLDKIPSIDLRVLHLIRDSRATVYSWSKKKEGLGQNRPLDTALIWSSRNISAELMALFQKTKYMRVRYEDFVSNPGGTIASIAGLAGKSGGEVQHLFRSELRLGSDHSIGGNPNRFETGRVEIRIDDAWRTRMKQRDYAFVTALTWPMLLRYRYQIHR